VKKKKKKKGEHAAATHCTTFAFPQTKSRGMDFPLSLTLSPVSSFRSSHGGNFF
jgi:hypothetical protein